MERLEFDLLFRWFVGLGIDDAVWDHLVLEEPRAPAGGRHRGQLLIVVLDRPQVKSLLS